MSTADVPPLRQWRGLSLLLPLVVGYRAGWVSAARLRAALVSIGLRGLDQQLLIEQGRRFALEVLPGMIRPKVRYQLEQHLQHGHRVVVVVVVVFASLDLYLHAWCAVNNVELRCSTLAFAAGGGLGRYAGPQRAGVFKVRVVSELLAQHGRARLHVCADSAEDHAMLELADRARYRGQLVRNKEWRL